VLATIKAKIWLIISAIGVGLLAALKIQSGRAEKWKKAAKQANADLKFRKEVDIIDAEIEQKFSHRADEARRDLDNDEIPDHLADPSNN
jgi:hypothetical protein